MKTKYCRFHTLIKNLIQSCSLGNRNSSSTEKQQQQQHNVNVLIVKAIQSDNKLTVR